jgi:hypothetical protein
MILIVREKVTPEQLNIMLEAIRHQMYVKVAIDLELGIVSGGGAMHLDCQDFLLDADLGCEPRNIWGAGWYVDTQTVAFDSLLNYRPPNNRTDEVENPEFRNRITQVIEDFFKGVQP